MKRKEGLNYHQNKAADKLAKAIRECSEVGLQGGVYDGVFCLWPRTAPNPMEVGPRFFERILMIGRIIDADEHRMPELDGGAGV